MKQLLLVTVCICVLATSHAQAIKPQLQKSQGNNRNQQTDNTFRIKISLEQDHELKNIIGISGVLHDFIKIDTRVKNIKWFEKNNPTSLIYDKPY